MFAELQKLVEYFPQRTGEKFKWKRSFETQMSFLTAYLQSKDSLAFHFGKFGSLGAFFWEHRTWISKDQDVATIILACVQLKQMN